MVSATKNNGKPIQKFLVETRDEIIIALHEEDYKVGQIATIMNRPKQTISHIILRHSRRIKKSR